MSNTQTHAHNTNTSELNHTISTDRPSKNLWCRDSYRAHIVKSLGRDPFIAAFKASLRSCPFSATDCRGAHCQEELVMMPHIYGYNNITKSRYDWVKLYLALIDTLKKDVVKVKNPVHILQITESLTQNFFVIIQVWREMACHYRKLKKEVPKRSPILERMSVHSSSYAFSDEVPEFNLVDTLENVAWCLTRLTKICSVRKTFDDKISANKKVTIMEMCLATGINCKDGVHHLSEMVCTDNFLTGSCRCVTKEALEIKEAEYLTEIMTLSKDLSKSASDFTPVQKTKKGKCSPQEAIAKKIIYLENLVERLYDDRKIHYTDEDMEPFDRQYANYIAQEDKKKKDKEAKEVWTHHLIDTSTVVKKVIKIIKPGMKKA